MLADIIAGIVILMLIIIAAKSYIKQRKSESCCGGCAGCRMNCHSKEKEEDK